MTHAGFISASYGLGVLVPAFFAVTAWARTKNARRRLAALDTRRGARA